MSFENPNQYNPETNEERELTPAERAVYYKTEKVLIHEYILSLHLTPPTEDDEVALAEQHDLIQKHIIGWINKHGKAYEHAFKRLSDQNPNFVNQCEEDPQSVTALLDEEIASIESAKLAA